MSMKFIGSASLSAYPLYEDTDILLLNWFRTA